MNNRAPKSLGRGQALQQVMAQSINSLNVTEMPMANYTNEKIMEFLETMTQRKDMGPRAQSLEPKNEEHLEYESQEERHNTFHQGLLSKDAVQSMPNVYQRKPKNSYHSSSNSVPGQFSFLEDDFPAICERGECASANNCADSHG